MKKLAAASAFALVFALSACGDANDDAADTTVLDTDTAPAARDVGTAGAGTTASSDWPEGSRIVEENGVTYRVESGGTRVQLEPGSARIVTEGSKRYRVDATGTRVEIDPNGTAIKIGDSIITGNAPNGASDIETPGETVTDAAEDAAEAVGDAVSGKR
jgi:hypothetical protein